eukprot:TRINITY_DN21494_c0_g1_i1.p1 TRINITY_DN21494_c0_g1~~TRINITY_DN21494_c0_g1_i1.p1  ORF type:complete len:242 (+),score=1.74 TRINITY_DN21494_c0_g1_i1:43-726(+)
MQQLRVGAAPPQPCGFSRTPNLSGMVGRPVATEENQGGSPEAAASVRDDATQVSVKSVVKKNEGFRLRVGVDVDRRKANIFIEFVERPRTMPELLQKLSEVLVWDWHGDGRHTPISISHLLMWSEIEQQWAYLCDPNDLDPNDQIYVFQKYQDHYTSGPLPPPKATFEEGEIANFRDPGILRIAADLYGTKVNYELKYENLPVIGALVSSFRQWYCSTTTYYASDTW